MKDMSVFSSGRVWIDCDWESVCFRYDHGRVFRKFYGGAEQEIDHANKLYNEAICRGDSITEQQYLGK